jgi:hypothetical protein
MTEASPYRLLLDADVLIKLSVLDCFSECITALGYTLAQCATMRSMTRSAGVDNQVVREQRAGGPGKPARRLFKTLSAIPTIDKLTDAEKLLSATITAAAQTHGLAFDGGEAMLASVAIHRGLPFVTTGDKKAIASLPVLARHVAEVAQLRGRLLPLEYLLLRAIQSVGLVTLHARIDSGKGCDAAVFHVVEEAGSDQAAFEGALVRKLRAVQARAPGFVPA